MKRVILIALAVAGLAAAAPGSAAAGLCGLPDSNPLWIDYGAPELADIFGRAGVIVAGSGEGYPAQMRTRGAQTIYWDMYLSKRVGTPSSPADPAALTERADRVYDFAVLTTGCQTPWIAMNELFGASVPTPWTPTTARYRQNVLDWARVLAGRGAKPVLLVSSDPFTGGEAAQWWRDVAQVADIVIQKYFNAPAVHKVGPELGSRRMRTSMRAAASKLFSINIPPSKLGFMLAFQTRPGSGGREGLKPASAWFEVAKLQALAAKQVARELGIAHIWSWGWGVFNEAGKDPDKAGAACVWLWARNPTLCDAPKLVGRFDDDLRAGQIDLPAGVRCALGERIITTNEIGELARLTGDAEVAFTALFARLVESGEATIGTDDVLAAERTILARRFSGSRTPYLAALARGRATRAVARGVVSDELRRRSIQSRLTVTSPSAVQLAEFQQTYGTVLAREVQVEPAPSWLPDGRGLVLAIDAPAQVFSARLDRGVTVSTFEGVFRVRPLAETAPLAAVPFAAARPAIGRALRRAAQADAFHGWTALKQKAALDQLRCVRDRLPQVGAIELTSYLPFLTLTEGA
ncbi:MAG: hypothetical protein H0V45_05125 [Actinobacteria bacterium]|nr:hypothetical protein [Actinomycetota bacterium]